MNDGVKILLERMKTHPEEFVVEEGLPAKWDNLIRSYETILDPEDIALFRQARAKLLQQQFTEKVLEELVDPKKSKWETVGMVTSNMPLATTTPALSSLTLEGSEHLKAHLKALQQEYADVFNKPKEHKTIFGKLFNYS
jgi:hypothetical protein